MMLTDVFLNSCCVSDVLNGMFDYQSESESTMKAAENEKTRRLGAALQAAAAIAEELAGRHAKQKVVSVLL